MPKYQILRTFPSSTPIRAGQIIEDPVWRNLPLLIKQRYVREVLEAPIKEVIPEGVKEVEIPKEIENPKEVKTSNVKKAASPKAKKSAPTAGAK